jgi:hypothetical protein
MKTQFLTYKKFHSLDQASELTDLLTNNKIPFEVEDNSSDLSDFIVGQNSNNSIVVKILPDHFLPVNRLLSDHADLQLNSINKDHYLFTFDDDELLEVVSEPDKWCELDKQLAKKILNERGITINDALENALFQKRVKDLSVEEKGSTIWTTVGYISAVLGGLIGIVIGINLWTSKKTLPDGTRKYVYTTTDRKHGQIITIIGIGMFCFWIYVRIRTL